MTTGYSPESNLLARCAGPRSSNPRPGVPFANPPLEMRETIIIAAACFLILVMAAALIIHFVVP
jgi:hypothetical protein